MTDDRPDIDSQLQEDITVVNELLRTKKGTRCRWWLYSVTHRTFELVVGDPAAGDNIVLSLSACSQITGPVQWNLEALEVLRQRISEHAPPETHYTLQDPGVGFAVHARTLTWISGYNLLDSKSLAFARGQSRPASGRRFTLVE
jgi:hypothetical protein